MNLISARVASDFVGCVDEDYNSHDATLSSNCAFVYLERAPSSGENYKLPLSNLFNVRSSIQMLKHVIRYLASFIPT